MEFKYFLTFENTKRFIQHKFGNDRLLSSAESNWYPLNPHSRTEYVKLITRTTLDLHDDYWGFE